MFVFKGHHEYGLNLSYYYDQTFDIALLIGTISQSILLQYSAFTSSQDYHMYTVPSWKRPITCSLLRSVDQTYSVAL